MHSVLQRHPQGVVCLKFKQPEEAETVIEVWVSFCLSVAVVAAGAVAAAASGIACVAAAAVAVVAAAVVAAASIAAELWLFLFSLVC